MPLTVVNESSFYLFLEIFFLLFCFVGKLPCAISTVTQRVVCIAIRTFARIELKRETNVADREADNVNGLFGERERILGNWKGVAERLTESEMREMRTLAGVASFYCFQICESFGGAIMVESSVVYHISHVSQ